MLICDFAETYHILNYRGLPLRLAATLACGLGAESRVVQFYSGIKPANTNILIATVADAVNVLTYAMASDRKKPPARVVDILTGRAEDRAGFATGEDFEKARAALLERINNAG